MKERLFTPKSLARVAEAVEWEDDLVVYPDGTTNQEQYIKAVAILWERWLRLWALPDLGAALQEVRGRNFAAGLVRIFRTIPERIFQLKGFYEGLWAGANPGRRIGIGTPRSVVWTVEGPEQAVMTALESMLEQLRAILFVTEEDTNE